jgi:hypothetical protein
VAHTILGTPSIAGGANAPSRPKGNPLGPRAVSDRFRAPAAGAARSPARLPEGRRIPQAVAAVSDATSIFTPGPMEELTAAFFR